MALLGVVGGVKVGVELGFGFGRQVGLGVGWVVAAGKNTDKGQQPKEASSTTTAVSDSFIPDRSSSRLRCIMYERVCIICYYRVRHISTQRNTCVLDHADRMAPTR